LEFRISIFTYTSQHPFIQTSFHPNVLLSKNIVKLLIRRSTD
jgi:hypothetical protein